MIDSQLELEKLASKIISGMIYPKEYLTTVTNLSQLKMLDVSEELTVLLTELQKKVIDSDGFLKDKEIESYYYGKNDKLYQLLLQINEQVTQWIPIYQQATLEKGEELVNDLSNNMEGQDFVGMGEAIDVLQSRKQEVENISNTKTQLEIFEGKLHSLLMSFGKNSQKLPKKSIITPSIGIEYQLFLQDLFNNIDVVSNSAELSIVLGRLLKSLIAAIPKVTLDPYRIEESENVIMVLCNPDDYYKYCETDRVDSDSVGKLFQFCYPAFYNRYIDLYLEKYEKMDYQKQIVFRKCFAITENNSQLLSLTSQYIKLGYT